MTVNITDIPDNYEYRHVMTIAWDDGSFEEHYDGGAPEDNMFCRDWSWVKPAIERAYNDGYKYGKSHGDLIA